MQAACWEEISTGSDSSMLMKRCASKQGPLCICRDDSNGWGAREYISVSKSNKYVKKNHKHTYIQSVPNVIVFMKYF